MNAALGRSRQSFDEQIRGERREHERRQEHDVVRDDRMDARRPQRDSRERGQEHRVGERQRERLGVEDIAVEERPGIATPLLVHPAHPPHREQRIAEIGYRVHPPHLRLEQNRAEDEDAEGRERRPRPPSPRGDVYSIGGRLEEPGTPLLPLRPVDAKRPDARREPPADGQRDRRRNQGAVGGARRRTDAADLDVEASGPGHHHRPDGERQGEPVETDGYTRSQPWPANLNRVSDM